MKKCQVCNENESYIRFDGDPLCLNCYNDMMAEQLGVAATSYPEGIAIKDGQGKVHQFRLRKRLDPVGVIMDAEEEIEGGYQFREYGELHEDQGALLLRLLVKAESGMSKEYIEKGEFPNGQTYHSLPNDRLAGRVEPSGEDHHVPVLVVNGKQYSWDELGRILTHYEGFQVKLEMVDISEELTWEE